MDLGEVLAVLQDDEPPGVEVRTPLGDRFRLEGIPGLEAGEDVNSSAPSECLVCDSNNGKRPFAHSEPMTCIAKIKAEIEDHTPDGITKSKPN